MHKRDHTELICNIGELSGLFEDATSLEVFLQKIVEMIAKHMNSDVCSIYLYDERQKELVLKATKGLHVASAGDVRLSLGEGLTGIALKEMRVICEKNASKNAGYRYFPDIGEELYESFLAVPMLRGQMRIGVIVIQNIKRNYFNEEDIRALRAITSQLANIVETTKTLMELNIKKGRDKEDQIIQIPKFIKGKVGSKGFAFAESAAWNDEPGAQEISGAKHPPAYSLEDFHSAVKLTEEQLENLQRQIEEKLSDVASLIFTAQILMLKDQAFLEAIETLIREHRCNPVAAIGQIVGKYVDMFDALTYPHLREKKQDVKDVGKRLIDNLCGTSEKAGGYKNKIIIARELLPSEVLELSSQEVAGIILLSGGITSHLSILARSLQMPLVISDQELLLKAAPGTPILMDAEHGNIYVDPPKDIIDSFLKKKHERRDIFSKACSVKDTTYTKDGTNICLLANINLLNDLKAARAFKAEGVGLYRTEFPFMVRSSFPSEEEQYAVYKKLVEGIEGKEITFRTLDIGGDKVLSYYNHIKEENPFMGMRSIRFSLKHKDIFIQQLRAILRAGKDADLRIMFPMISSLDEFLEAKLIIKECIGALRTENAPCHCEPKIGIMVELPAVLEIIEPLARAADFLSIGTNDFIQYLLAVDRTNEKVAEYYLPEHPAVLRALKKVVQAAKKYKKDVSICGDMAHEERYIRHLLGIGIRKLSVDPYSIPAIQGFIATLDLSEIEKQTRKLMAHEQIKDIVRLMDGR